MTTISTRRLFLQNYAQGKGHLEMMVKWLNDPDVTRYSEQRHKKHTIQSQTSYVLGHPNFLEIYASHTLIGTIAADVDHNNSVANVGILIGDKKTWGKGYGTEAWTAYCDHLLGNGIRKIEGGCMASNFGMLKIFRKSGMFYEGRRTAHFLCGEDTVDVVMWGKFGD